MIIYNEHHDGAASEVGREVGKDSRIGVVSVSGVVVVGDKQREKNRCWTGP